MWKTSGINGVLLLLLLFYFLSFCLAIVFAREVSMWMRNIKKEALLAILVKVFNIRFSANSCVCVCVCVCV